MKVTLEIPDEIAKSLESRKENLPQILALGLRELDANPSVSFSGLTEILEFLARLPSPQEILALRLSPVVQAQVYALLDKNRTRGLDENDRLLWKHYEFVEHLVRLAKAQALSKLH